MSRTDRRCSIWSAIAIALVGLLVLVAAALPRFGARGEPAMAHLFSYELADGEELVGLTVDMREYLHGTEYWAGVTDAPSVAPFTSRLAVPFVAGQLPWSAPTSFNVVVLAALALGLVALIAAWVRLELSAGAVLLGTLAYALAFPVFYWSSFIYVDGAVVGLLAVLLAALVFDRPWIALLVLMVAVLAKESGLAGVPVVMVWAWLDGPSDAPLIRQRRTWIAVAAVIVGIATMVLARVVGPTATEFYNPWLPTPSQISRYFGANLGRPGPLAQVVFTAAIPAALVLLAWRRRSRGEPDLDPRLFWTAMTGVVMALLLNVQALFTAQWDGRTLWTAYPYAATLGAAAWHGLANARSSERAGEQGEQRAQVQ